MAALTEILIEVDRDTNLTGHLHTHAGSASPRVSDVEHRRNLYAAILAQAPATSDPPACPN